MIFSPFERMVALRYLRARREEGFVSVIAGFSLAGIALGVATLIIVMSVMNGFRAELLQRILGLNGHVGVYELTNQPLRDFDELAAKIKVMAGVKRVIPTVEGQVLVSANNVAAGAIVRGARVKDIKAREIISGNIRAGSLDEFEGKNSVLVGTRFSQKFGVRPGDMIRLVSPQSNSTAFGSVPRSKRYRVAAIFEVGMFEYDSSFVFMPLEAAQIYFRSKNAVTNIEVFLDDPDRVEYIRTEILRAAGKALRIVDWQQANASFFNAIKVERNVMFLILTLIILVAAFNIISGMIMMVKDKGRDIAILRTMGATRGMVMRVFLLAGASVGIIGTLIGFGLGVAFAGNIETIRQWLQSLTGTELFAAEIYFLSQLPSVVEPGDVLSVVGMSLGLSFLAVLYPAWRAARLDPVEALRYE
ncbi:MAG: lipoprotein-releasing system transmembrane subunit LolC [Rhodospirillaceae bacterium]|nr:lipoprotein-releasing system transmembrane subunit LolC [Rhodospirillaceae bacterium]